MNTLRNCRVMAREVSSGAVSQFKGLLSRREMVNMVRRMNKISGERVDYYGEEWNGKVWERVEEVAA